MCLGKHLGKAFATFHHFLIGCAFSILISGVRIFEGKCFNISISCLFTYLQYSFLTESKDITKRATEMATMSPNPCRCYLQTLNRYMFSFFIRKLAQCLVLTVPYFWSYFDHVLVENAS